MAADDFDHGIELFGWDRRRHGAGGAFPMNAPFDRLRWRNT
jgi:hypothetical protein